MTVPPKEIREWLQAKYTGVGEKKFILSEKDISSFQKNYLDFYLKMKQDLLYVQEQKSSEDQLSESLQNNPTYLKKLEEYADTEVDIKLMIKRMVVNIEHRAAQVFDMIQADHENMKMDRSLVEWFNLLLTTIEKFDKILNGSPDQVNIQNNINIQVVDQHINVVYNVIKDILSKLDYDTSIMFIDMFNEEMKKIKPVNNEATPAEIRLEEVKKLSESVDLKII